MYQDFPSSHLSSGCASPLLQPFFQCSFLPTDLVYQGRPDHTSGSGSYIRAGQTIRPSPFFPPFFRRSFLTLAHIASNPHDHGQSRGAKPVRTGSQNGRWPFCPLSSRRSFPRHHYTALTPNNHGLCQGQSSVRTCPPHSLKYIPEPSAVSEGREPSPAT